MKANVYIAHPNDYRGMDRVWKQWFPNDPPARVVIPYMGLGGMGTRIEIDMILLPTTRTLERKTISADSAFEPLGHEPQAMQAGEFLFFSTQVPTGPDGVADELLGHPELPFCAGHDPPSGEPDVRQHGARSAEAAGTSLENLCQVKEFYEDLSSFAAVREEWRARFGDAPPASTSVEVGAPLIAPGARLLMDAIGHVPAAG